MSRSAGGLAGRRILVTGATGFIGSRLCERLRACGADVHAASRGLQEARGDGVERHRLELADADRTLELVSACSPDAILHAAGHVDGARALEQVLPTLQANLVGTVNLLVAAQRAGCRRVVLAGSMEEPPPGSEEVPGSPYAVAKTAAGTYARTFHALFGTPVVTLRIFMAYGPGQRDATKLVPYVTRSLLRGEAPSLASGARPVDWVYVDDVVDAFVAAVDADGVEGASIDVGSGELVSVREVVETIARLVGGGARPRFGELPDRPFETSRAADLGPAARLLGWRPATSLEQGLAATVAWYADREA